MNARETLKAIEHWLSWQDETLSDGLQTVKDALRLYAYAQAHPDLPEMADEWKPKHLRAALGYDPLGEKAQTLAHERFRVDRDTPMMTRTR
jgi:hypothetical protein